MEKNKTSINNDRHHVIVFDLDGTLCTRKYDHEIAVTKELHPECPVIDYLHEGKDLYPHVFMPYLEILFNYLIDAGARIVFFSSAIEARNVHVLNELLEQILGHETYEELLSKGQFDILSRQHMRPRNDEFRERGGFIKDFNTIIKNGEDFLDCILIEDQPSYTAYDQDPCIGTIDCEFWRSTSSSREHDYPKNATYYLLGIFRNYFESIEFNQLPLRLGIKKMFSFPSGNIKDDRDYPQSTKHVQTKELANKLLFLGLNPNFSIR